MDNRIALNARLRELESAARTAARHRDAELERMNRLYRMATEARAEAEEYADEARDAEYDADLIRRALQVSPDSELDAVWSALRSNRITAPDSSLPPSDADPATGATYGDLT